MKLKFIWEESDIEAGVYAIRNSSPKGSINTGFARSVTIKIGYNNSSPDSKYGKIACFTDGRFCPIADTKEEVANWLNENDYRPLTKEEYINLIETTDQGFIKL